MRSNRRVKSLLTECGFVPSFDPTFYTNARHASIHYKYTGAYSKIRSLAVLEPIHTSSLYAPQSILQLQPSLSGFVPTFTFHYRDYRIYSEHAPTRREYTDISTRTTYSLPRNH